MKIQEGEEKEPGGCSTDGSRLTRFALREAKPRGWIFTLCFTLGKCLLPPAQCIFYFFLSTGHSVSNRLWSLSKFMLILNTKRRKGITNIIFFFFF